MLSMMRMDRRRSLTDCGGIDISATMERTDLGNAIEMIDQSKRHMVRKLCELAVKMPIVERIIVFGSAAENACTENSDLDICYVLNCDTKDKRARELSVETSRICDYNCDVVYYDLIGEELKHEIDAKGIVVYEV